MSHIAQKNILPTKGRAAAPGINHNIMGARIIDKKRHQTHSRESVSIATPQLVTAGVAEPPLQVNLVLPTEPPTQATVLTVVPELPAQPDVVPSNQLCIIFNGAKQETKFDIMHPTTDAGMFRIGNTYQGSELSPATRLIFYEIPTTISICVRRLTLLPDVNALLTKSVCLSSVFPVSTEPNPSPEVRQQFFFTEFHPDQDLILADGHDISIKDLRIICLDWMWERMFPKRELDHELFATTPFSHENDEPMPLHNMQVTTTTYDHEAQKLFVVLDMDKTLLVSNPDYTEHCKRCYKLHCTFREHFMISGHMAINNDWFQYNMMLRPGVYWFLHRLKRVAEIFVESAGDLHYVRTAITHANARWWVLPRGQDPTTDDLWVLMEPNEEITAGMLVEVDPSNPSVRYKFTGKPVSIPLTRIFSVRQRARYCYVTGTCATVPKTFDRVLPFAQFMTSGANTAVLSVDDDPEAWDVKDRRHVIPISPFQPCNNSHEDLLHVVWLIEEAAKRYYNHIHHMLSQLSPSSVPTWSEPTAVVNEFTPITKVETDCVQFFNMGYYAVWSKPGEHPKVWNCANGLQLHQATESQTAFTQFLSSVTQDRKLDEGAKAMIKMACPNIADWVWAITNTPAGQEPTVAQHPLAPVIAAPVAAAAENLKCSDCDNVILPDSNY